ncbi:phosphoribosyl-AMP cyclohydrolase [bacterium]|nr:phosphoribosyl-AMP cyclohydrolase [bacterium]
MTFSPPLDGVAQDETRELRPKFNAEGLIAAIAQDADTGEVLMLAWMNAEALELTLSLGRAVYWSRSRGELWRKGDTSGHSQSVVDVMFDCDQDAVLLKVRQTGAACHTGRRSCFYRATDGGGGLRFTADDPGTGG